ncbi:MAG: hypothetical protein RIR36_1074, partial [Bacteroidota bacterium]
FELRVQNYGNFLRNQSFPLKLSVILMNGSLRELSINLHTN